jgi:hypothetical protein
MKYGARDRKETRLQVKNKIKLGKFLARIRRICYVLPSYNGFFLGKIDFRFVVSSSLRITV